MGIAPGLNPTTENRLREIDEHFVARWDDKKEHWQIWHESAGARPYIVASVCDDNGDFIPIDGRTFRTLEHAVWVAKNDLLLHQMRESVRQDRREREYLDRKEYELYKDMAVDMRRPVQMLAREYGIASGKARIPYSTGWGAGRS